MHEGVLCRNVPESWLGAGVRVHRHYYHDVSDGTARRDNERTNIRSYMCMTACVCVTSAGIARHIDSIMDRHDIRHDYRVDDLDILSSHVISC